MLSSKFDTLNLQKSKPTELETKMKLKENVVACFIIFKTYL